jgi:hypothetical protein
MRSFGQSRMDYPLAASQPIRIGLIPKGAYTPTESSRVQSSPVRLTKTRQRLCDLRATAAAAVRTHQQSRVDSSPTSLAESSLLMQHVPFS